jgi:hypothetical protein
MRHLTKQNAHRALTVKNINNPEWGEKKFNYKVECNLYSTVGIGCDSAILYENEYRFWEIVNCKYPVLLEDFDDLAKRAFYWTSFNPDERGIRAIREHEEQLNADIKDIPEDEKERYISNYKKYFSAWLSAHSNCASSAITGASGFNSGKAEKANNRERARMEDFVNWRDKALKSIAKRIEANKPEEQKQSEEWGRLKRIITSRATTIMEINTGKNKYSSKALFVNNLYRKVETFAKRGDVETVKKAIDYVRELNKETVVITERHKFFTLIEVAESSKAKQAENSEKANTEVPFKGGKIVNNFSENRIQLIFNEKPSADTITALKKASFKWSPRFNAWQRQMTGNAVYATKRFLSENNLIQ